MDIRIDFHRDLRAGCETDLNLEGKEPAPPPVATGPQSTRSAKLSCAATGSTHRAVYRIAMPAYQLAVTVDDAEMRITEVVRGADLLKSTARRLLLYRALGWTPPAFYHCDLVLDDSGTRLAKRHDALSIRRLRQRGWTPEQVLAGPV
jgi:hypothetical protein